VTAPREKHQADPLPGALMLHRTRARDRGTLAAAAAGALAAAVVVSATIDPRDPEPVRVRAADRAGERRLGNGSEAGRAAHLARSGAIPIAAEQLGAGTSATGRHSRDLARVSRSRESDVRDANRSGRRRSGNHHGQVQRAWNVYAVRHGERRQALDAHAGRCDGEVNVK